MSKTKKAFEGLIGVIFALAVWYLAAVAVGQRVLLASPIDVLKRFPGLISEANFIRTVLFSCMRIVLGFIIGLTAGIVCAAAAYHTHWLQILISPFVRAMKTIPVASFIVVSLIWFSSSGLSIFISFIMVFPIVYIALLESLNNTNKDLLEVAVIFNMSYLKKVRYIYLPSLYSPLCAACSSALGLAWKAGIAAEVIGIPTGSIGERLYQSKLYLDTTDLFAWTIVIVILGIICEKLMRVILRWVMRAVVEL